MKLILSDFRIQMYVLDDVCGTIVSDSKEKILKKRKKRIIRKRKFKGYLSVMNNENYSYHYAEFPDGSISMQFELTPCQ
jgi:hypothetical protein